MKLPDIALSGALALTALLACLRNSEASSAINQHIFGGASASKGEIPWQAHVFSPQYCGGSIISSTWILTAAHCNNGHLPSQVYVGGVRFNFEDAEMVIEKFTHYISHDDYIPFKVDPSRHDPRNDIALLGLAEELQFSENVMPATLPSYSHPPLPPGTVVLISGLGHTSDNDNDPTPDRLQYVELTLTFEEHCIQGRKLCATATDRSIKLGDSGGPWIWKDQEGVNRVVGVGISGNAVADEGTYISRATNVFYYLDWISSTTGIEIDS